MLNCRHTNGSCLSGLGDWVKLCMFFFSFDVFWLAKEMWVQCKITKFIKSLPNRNHSFSWSNEINWILTATTTLKSKVKAFFFIPKMYLSHKFYQWTYTCERNYMKEEHWKSVWQIFHCFNYDLLDRNITSQKVHCSGFINAMKNQLTFLLK